MFKKKEDSQLIDPFSATVNPDQPKLINVDPDRSILFRKICDACQKLFEEKNAKYGDSIVYTGVLGATVELVGCVGRLRKLVLHSANAGQSEFEVLLDVLKDTLNYANIAMQMMQEENWKGK